MKFRTIISPKEQVGFFNHSQCIIGIGSCFTGNIGAALKADGFKFEENPFGILFHPNVIALNITNAFDTKVNEDLITQREELFYHHHYHSSINASSKALLIAEIKALQLEFIENIKKADRLILTFGTAWTYLLKAQKEVVANCHKVPQHKFLKQLTSLAELTALYKVVLTKLHAINPNLKVVLTVSPIRHLKDGLVENSQSKGTLLLLTRELVQAFHFVSYFPSYEIMMDDLRDYRFYEADMLHPNQQAITYIYEQFKSTYFSADTLQLANLYHKLNLLNAHKVFNNSDSNRLGLENKKTQLMEQITALKSKL